MILAATACHDTLFLQPCSCFQLLSFTDHGTSFAVFVNVRRVAHSKGILGLEILPGDPLSCWRPGVAFAFRAFDSGELDAIRDRKSVV